MRPATSISEVYQQQFNGKAILVAAPGRINLIGEHTDYNHGLVLPAAIDCRLQFALGRNTADANEVKIFSANFEEWQHFSLNPTVVETRGWIRYVQAVCGELQKRNYPLQGFYGAFGGDIPIGSGLSSSAAMTCGLIYALAELFDWTIAREEIALIAQAAEHRVGIRCGLMDQYAVLFGQEGKVIQLDCRDLSIDYFPCELGDHCLLLLNTKVEHELAATGYNDRRASCERVLQQVQSQNPSIQNLRDINEEILERTSTLNPLDVQRVRFVLAENERVRQTTIALQAGDLKSVGNLLYQSHQGLSEEYEVSCAELDVLVEFSKAEADILGARMMGGGFGGCTINLVKNSEAAAIATRMLEKYHVKTGLQGEAYIVNIGAGVCQIE